jgi:hypothetical protein
MNEIISPLTPRMQGPTVADLQDALQQCLDRGALLANDEGARRELTAGLVRERGEQTYVDATRKLVSIFQSDRHMQASGEVDAPTADALNKLLREWGLLDHPVEQPEREVYGSVRRSGGAPIGGAVIQVLGRTPAAPAVLAQSHTDENGRYSVKFVPPAGATLVVRVVATDAAGTQLAASEDIRIAQPSVGIDLTVDEQGAMTYRVSGTVESANMSRLIGLQVTIVDKNVGGDIVLAQAQTDDWGSFFATFDASAFRSRGKERPDLQARVAGRGDAVLGVSPIYYDASPSTTMVVELDERSATQSLPSEHEALTGVLARHFKGRLADLKENEHQQDVSYLANKTGWDARAVAMASLADSLSARSAGDAAQRPVAGGLFYALLRAGLPADESALYRTDIGIIRSVWQSAMIQGVIPTLTDAELETAVSGFQAKTATALLNGAPLIGLSTLKDMLVAARLSEDQQATFARLYAAHQSDPQALWTSVGAALGQEVSSRLQIDGKLGLVTLNNAPLMAKVHAVAFAADATDTVQLARAGYHAADAWSSLLTAEIPIPREIPGGAEGDRRKNYADLLAAQVRLSYPTASIGQLIKSGKVALRDAPAGAADEIERFLTAHHDRFDLGTQPVEQFVADNKIEVAEPTLRQIKRLQRAYQITSGDNALAGLLRRGVDSALDVVRHERAAFIKSFADDLGGPDQAGATYDRSAQVHNAVLGIALSYLHARTASAIGVHSPPDGVDPTPTAPDGVVAYATLEKLFGSMDYCACEQCRSILSPAAYLVDLLQYLDIPDLPAGMNNPQAVLLERRPDIQHLPLSCENTNTALPYIDIVNETLEYFIANTKQPLTLGDYPGHDTAQVASTDLLASPQFIMDTAYTLLRQQRFPSPLPFNLSLELTRRYLARLNVPLAELLERLRRSDDLERGSERYGWRDIWMEVLGLSREEHETLADSNAVPLWRMFGFASGTADPDVIAELSNATRLTRRLGISYENLIDILRTRFINPDVQLIPKIERLGVPLSALSALKAGTLSDTDFLKAVNAQAPEPERAHYGGDIAAWVKNADNYDRIMGLVVLAIPAVTWTANHAYAAGDLVVPGAYAAVSNLYFECTTAGNSAGAEPAWVTTPGMPCSDGQVVWTCRDASSDLSIEHLALRRADPSKVNISLDVSVFVRLARFVRLWRKLNWTIDQTDVSLNAYFLANHSPPASSDLDSVAKLDQGFLTALPRLGIAARVMSELNLSVDEDLRALLACSANIDAAGTSSLYVALFLNPSILAQDAVFADNGYGEFLADPAELLLNSASVQRAVLGGAIKASDELVTVINGVEVRYQADATDTSLTQLAKHVVDAVNAAAVKDPRTGRPLREIVKADSNGSSISVTALDASYTFTLRCWTAFGSSVVYTARDHEAALQAALSLTGDEFRSIVAALNFGSATPLNLATVSAIFRCGWLARKLGLSVRELLAFIDMTGIDPFAPVEAANPGMVRLLRLVSILNENRLTVTSTLYLLWNVDLTGQYGATVDTVTSTAAALRADLALVASQLETPADANTDAASTAVTLVYGNDTASAFFGLLDDTIKFEVGYTLDAQIRIEDVTNADGQIRYDEFRHVLAHTGILTPDQQAALDGVNNVTQAFKDAVGSLQTQGEEQRALFFTQHPEFKAAFDLAQKTATANRRQAFFEAFKPIVSLRRKRQQALQRLATSAQIDNALCGAILETGDAPSALHGAGQNGVPALDDALAIELGGLEASIYFKDKPDGTPDRTDPAIAVLDYAPTTSPLPASPGALSLIWRGLLEGQESGLYNIIITSDTGSQVSLSLGTVQLERMQGGPTWRNKNAISLTAGALYPIEISVANAKDAFRVEWETPTRKREVIPSRYLYPRGIVDTFRTTYVRLLKTATLANTLSLTPREVSYLAQEDQIDGSGWLNALPVTGMLSGARANALLKPLETMLAYGSVRRSTGVKGDDLLKIIDAPGASLATGDAPLFRSTGWRFDSTLELLDHFGLNAGDLSSVTQLHRLSRAMERVKTSGLSARALLNAATNDPSEDTVQNLRGAFRGRYETSAWRDAVRPINDELRALRRDALVAYILHSLRADATRSDIDTPDKLFEYFLMDVRMEPCMETSRVRHALSSVQLFIERCLMNLETAIAPESFSAAKRKAWNWMKRYRVWEANRKVYLYPENWAEPELRDDKSPFFKEIESELLQGDITEDRAATALLNYLTKLEEVGKLEQCSICYIPGDAAQNTPELVHLVARTAGATRKYFYRHCEAGAWSAWEQIKLDIEDEPITLIVWRDRLLLFWVRVIQQKEPTPDVPQSDAYDGENLAGTTVSAIKAGATSSMSQSPPQVTVRVVLCFSEYRDGKWQATKTSSVERAPALGSYAAGRFDRSSLWLAVGDVFSHLRIEVQDGFTLGGKTCFYLYNTHSSPVSKDEGGNPPSWPFFAFRYFNPPPAPLTVNYIDVANGNQILQRPVLSNALSQEKIMPPRHLLADSWHPPFLYEDARYVFNVQTTFEPVWIPDFEKYGAVSWPRWHDAAKIPPMQLTVPQKVVKPRPYEDPLGVHLGLPNAGPQAVIANDAWQRRTINAPGAINFGSQLIGPTGPVQPLPTFKA